MTTTKICVDANFIVRLISSDPPYSPIEDLWNEWLDSGYEIVAPTLMYYEVSNAFHRMSLAGQISAETAIELMESALDLGITLYGDRSLHQKALNLASTLRLPASYDAHYLALAEELSVEFYTADRRLFNAVSSSLNWVNLIA